MKAAPFEYMRPKTLAEACAALAKDGAVAIAGGQSLIPMLNLRVALADIVVDISRLTELKRLSETSAGVHMGALTTHAAIEDGRAPDLFNGLMRRVAAQISYRSVRNHGTIGGSVALADPAADWPPCLMALGAMARVCGPNGERSEAVGDLVQGPYATSLVRGEIIVGFDLPRPAAPLRWGFAKVARKSGAFASSIAFVVANERNGPVSLALGAAGPRPCALPSTAKEIGMGASEEALRGAIASDLEAHVPGADAYERRLHTATVLKAIREMHAQ